MGGLPVFLHYTGTEGGCVHSKIFSFCYEFVLKKLCNEEMRIVGYIMNLRSCNRRKFRRV